jgi:hypothetical protein
MCALSAISQVAPSSPFLCLRSISPIAFKLVKYQVWSSTPLRPRLSLSVSQTNAIVSNAIVSNAIVLTHTKGYSAHADHVPRHGDKNNFRRGESA